MKKSRITPIMFLILFISITGIVRPQHVPFSRTEDIIYGRKDGMALTMDLFKPENPNGIGVLAMISGGWLSSHDHISAKWLDRIKHLTDHHETVFAVVHSSAVKYKIPDIKKDIDRAVRFIRFNAGKWNVDAERLGIVGESSGGHLSLLQASTGSEGDPQAVDSVERVSSKLQAAACFFPPADLIDLSPLGAHPLPDSGDKYYVKVLTSNINDPDEIKRIAGEYSPLLLVTAAMPPTLIITGDSDKLVPYQQSVSFMKRLEELGVPHRLDIRKGNGHGWPEIPADYEIVAEWFEKYMGKK
jgi:acetyl esterase/lipase